MVRDLAELQQASPPPGLQSHGHHGLVEAGQDLQIGMRLRVEADGEIEPEEQKVLEEVGRRLGLRVEDYI